MKFTYQWLQQYVDIDWSPQELAERLTFAGVEVESMVTLGGDLPAEVVIAQIVASEKHPNADKLSVCRVHDGRGERQIVCGAKNYKVGDKVPLALPGAKLAGNVTIREAKLRGVLSQGMLCSAQELGLGPGEDGLLILPADAPLGRTLTEYRGAADTVFDIEVTPNRPDWLSLIGVAREVAALSGRPLRLPAIPSRSAGEELPAEAVRVEAPELCPRYSARLIRGVRVGPSPAWLRERLEAVGLRSINNVVDITNYVLWECGHPLHAFDYDLLAGQRIVVRRARAGERFTALDGRSHELTGEMLVIADAERPVALAGIIGGRDSAVHGATTNVLLESAWFLPASVRRTSKRLGLVTDSSYRFERGADRDGLLWASDRAAALLAEWAGGQVGAVRDVQGRPLQRRRVACRYDQVERVLGVAVPAETVKTIFVRLGMTPVNETADRVEVEVPSYRVDLEREADLIEEICRIHGVEKIPARRQPSLPAVSAVDAEWDARRRLRETLTGLGFYEVVNQTMVAEGAVRLQNPLNAAMTALRSSLVPGLLTNLRTNVSRHEYDLKLFEIGRVFDAAGRERWKLALAMCGRRHPGDWQRTEMVDYFDLKGVLEALGVSADITEIPVANARKLDLRDAVYLAECDLPAPSRDERQFVELPKFPAVVRDVALIVDESVTHATVVAEILRQQNNLLERVELFDIYRGGSIPTGKKSLAYSLTFRAADRTLTDAEVNAAHEQIKTRLQERLPCEIRAG